MYNNDTTHLLCSLEHSGIVHENRTKNGKAGMKIIQRRMSLNQLQKPPSFLAYSAFGGRVRMAGQHGRHGQICIVSSSSSCLVYKLVKLNPVEGRNTSSHIHRYTVSEYIHIKPKPSMALFFLFLFFVLSHDS